MNAEPTLPAELDPTATPEATRGRTSASSLPRIALTGFAMGSADVVPGVSGGTVALVLGVYDQLVGAIRQGVRGLSSLLRGRFKEGVAHIVAVDWPFLVSLLFGIAAAVVLLASVLEGLLEEQPIPVSAAFLGLVLGSVVAARSEVGELTPRVWAIGIVSAAATFVLLGAKGGSLSDPSSIVLVAGGALAICAMILPGVSGSFLLLLVGLYDVVLGAVNDRDFGTIALVGIGAVLGLALFSTFLSWLLERHRATVMAVLLGLMVGSTRVLWPWPAGDDGVADTALGAPNGQVALSAVLAVVAFALVITFAHIARRSTAATAER